MASGPGYFDSAAWYQSQHFSGNGAPHPNSSACNQSPSISGYPPLAQEAAGIAAPQSWNQRPSNVGHAPPAQEDGHVFDSPAWNPTLGASRYISPAQEDDEIFDSAQSDSQTGSEDQQVPHVCYSPAWNPSRPYPSHQVWGRSLDSNNSDSSADRGVRASRLTNANQRSQAHAGSEDQQVADALRCPSENQSLSYLSHQVWGYSSNSNSDSSAGSLWATANPRSRGVVFNSSSSSRPTSGKGSEHEALYAGVAGATHRTLCPVAPDTPKSQPIAETCKIRRQTRQSHNGFTGQWSTGSRLHAEGSCKPCAWSGKPKGCRDGAACSFCHMCDVVRWEHVDAESDRSASSRSKTSVVDVLPKADPVELVDAEKSAEPQASTGSMGMPMSELHDAGQCKPCLYMNTKAGCMNGATCRFCHQPHVKKSRPRPCKSKRAYCKQMVSMLQANFKPESEEFAEESNRISNSSFYARSLLQNASPGQPH